MSQTAYHILWGFPLFLSLSVSLSPHPCCFHGNLPVDGEGEEEVEDRAGQVDQSDDAWCMFRPVLWENWEASTVN